MNKISDYIGYYYREKGFNCAETVLCAANDAWDLHLEPAVIRTMGGFGGGMGTRNVCGAVSGGIAALSGLIGGAGVAAAAGCKTQSHGQGQQSCQKLLHSSHPPV